MRRKKGLDPNMKFLFGSVFFFFILIVIIGLFTYFTLHQYWNDPNTAKKVAKAVPVYDYSVRFDKGFAGTSYTLYLNDDVIYQGNPVNADTVIYSTRKAPENSLLIVDNSTDKLVEIIELEKKANIQLNLSGGTLTYTVK